VDEALESAKERGWREVAAIDDAYARDELDDEGWHRAVAALVVPAYLGAETPEGGSGHSGTPDDWDYSRCVVGTALDRDGTFLDVGCANGLLVESVSRWAAAKRLALEEKVASWGFRVAGRAERAHRLEPWLASRVFWIEGG